MTSINKNSIFVLLFLIIIGIGACLRLSNLSSNPPQLFEDEITNVLSARSIMETGKDIDGQLNLYFYNRVESRSPVYGYLAAISTYVFGDNTFAIRLPAALLGIVSIFTVYLIANKITHDKLSSIFASFLMAVIPWQVHYSRVGWEPAATVPLLLISIYLFLAGLNKKWLIIFSYIMFSITVFTHRSAEVLSPLFLGVLMSLNYKKILSNKLPNLVGLFLIIVALITVVTISLNDPNLHGRSLRIATFNDGVTTSSIKQFAKNYIAHFSGKFLFFHGDPNLRHGTGTDGVIYFWMIPLIVLGGIYVILNFNKFSSQFVLFWILIFPLGGSLTNDGVPHATRTLIGGPAFILLSAMGVVFLKQILTKHRAGWLVFYALLGLMIGLLSYQAYMFSKNYFGVYPSTSSIYWNYGNKQVFDYLKQNSDKFSIACLENINYWDEETLVEYYLPNNHLNIIAGSEDLRCSTPGALLVLNNPQGREGCITDKIIYNLINEPIILICQVP